MNILIRTDSNPQIGMGHLLRCLSLAKELRGRGAYVFFVMKKSRENRIEILKKDNFDVFCIPDENEDARETICIIKKLKKPIHWIIIDHYDIDFVWHRILRRFTKKIMVIDDIANRLHDCDLLLDQNYYLNLNRRYDKLVPKDCIKLLGPKFVLLRSQFKNRRIVSTPELEQTKHILIFFGGSDCSEITIKTINAILNLGKKNLVLDVVVNNVCSDLNIIKQLCALNSIRYFCEIENIADLMESADFSIGAGGITLWERCAMGLPSLVIAIADNQVEVAKDAESLGVLKYLGKSDHVTETEIGNAVRDLLNMPALLNDMRNKSKNLIDGMGCSVVTEVLYDNGK